MTAFKISSRKVYTYSCKDANALEVQMTLYLGNALSKSLPVVWGRTEKVLEEMSQARGWIAQRGKEQRAKQYSENGICAQPEITV